MIDSYLKTQQRIQSNLDFPPLYDHLYIRPFSEIKFEAFLINNLIVDESGLAYIKINEDILKEYNVDAATVTNMINNFNFVADYVVWTFIVNDPKLDNGGGHKLAAGCRIKTMEEVDKLLEELKIAAKEYISTMKDSE